MPHSNVYVRGVPVGFDTEDLRYLFENFGTIVSAKILEPRHVGDKRLGFVKFTTTAEALAAIASMDKISIAGHSLEVREAEFDVDPKKNVLDKALVENDNLFVRGFPSYWGAEALTEYFSRAGVVVSVRILSCTMPARGGVGLVRYRSVEEARAAVVQLHETSVDGFGPIHVKYSTVKEKFGRPRRAPFRRSVVAASLAFREAAASGSQETAVDCATTMNNDIWGTSSARAVLVSNLAATVTELLLYKEFAPHGAIASVHVGAASDGRCMGMAFVNFVEERDAVNAAQCMNGMMIEGETISVAAHN